MLDRVSEGTTTLLNITKYSPADKPQLLRRHESSTRTECKPRHRYFI